LAAYFRPGKQETHKKISIALRKYLALPMIKSTQIRGQVESLERDLQRIAATVQSDLATKLNKFHNYVVQYWMGLQGGGSISVIDAPHHTNNVMERYSFHELL